MKNYTDSEMQAKLAEIRETLLKKRSRISEKLDMHDNSIADRYWEKLLILDRYLDEFDDVINVISFSGLNSALFKRKDLFDKAVDSADNVEMSYKGQYHKVVLLYNFPYEKPLWAIYLGPQKVFQ